MANKNTITIDWTEVSKDWFDGIGWSANTSWRYRKFPDSKYDTNVEHDTIWYTIRGWWVWPLQWQWDYFIKLADDGFWDAVDSSWNVTRIPNIYYYYDKEGYIQPYDNWKSIRLRALEYWNTKNKDKIKSKADINVDWANNINWEWWKFLTQDIDKRVAEYIAKNPVTETEAREIVRPTAIDNFTYPYKDSNWNNLMTAPVRVTRWAIVRRPQNSTLRHWVRRFNW